MNTRDEINRGYPEYLRDPSGLKGSQTNDTPRAWGVFRSRVPRLIHLIVATPLLVLISIVLLAWLNIYVRVKRAGTGALNKRAAACVPDFVEQYPFHLYPVVCKSFELAFLKEKVDRLLAEGARFLEVAIGEGTFSARVFPRDAEVVGLDLSPYSLLKAVQMPHVRQAVVCDCLRLPIGPGHFDVILANNFLHHVTMKGETLANWSRVSRGLIVNENTPFWASSWTAPFLLRKLGAVPLAQRLTDAIEQDGLQHLEPKEALEALVCQDYEVIVASSYFSASTFFFCSLYSFIMHCIGPPTPRHLKDAFLSKYIRWLTIPLTTQVAKALIQYDQFQDRARDTYVSYVCESRHAAVRRTENYLMCPRCAGELTTGNSCKACWTQYSSRDGMLFLLPEEMESIETRYDPDMARSIPREHL